MQYLSWSSLAYCKLSNVTADSEGKAEAIPVQCTNWRCGNKAEVQKVNKTNGKVWNQTLCFIFCHLYYSFP